MQDINQTFAQLDHIIVRRIELFLLVVEHPAILASGAERPLLQPLHRCRLNRFGDKDSARPPVADQPAES